MRKLIAALTVFIALGASPAFAHHMAEGIVDEEIYAMIDDLVSDTPHAELDLEDLGSGMTGMTITTPSLRWLEDMIDDGLLAYVQMLDSLVDIAIAFNDDHSVVMTITTLSTK